MFTKVCIYIRKVTSTVKYFTEVRKTSEDVEVCPLLTSPTDLIQNDSTLSNLIVVLQAMIHQEHQMLL